MILLNERVSFRTFYVDSAGFVCNGHMIFVCSSKEMCSLFTAYVCFPLSFIYFHGERLLYDIE